MQTLFSVELVKNSIRANHNVERSHNKLTLEEPWRNNAMQGSSPKI